MKAISYEYDKAALICYGNDNRIVFVNFGDDADAFGYFVDDFTNDLNSISRKHGFEKSLGRISGRTPWILEIMDSKKYQDIKDTSYFKQKITDISNKRRMQYIVQLLTKSFNDKTSVNIESSAEEGDLSKILNRIVRHDTNQTRYINDVINMIDKNDTTYKGISVSGRAGTGKT